MTQPSRKRGRPVDPELRARREAQILDAAARAFAEKGYAGLDVEELAASIGVGKGTVYRYFPTKEALFLAALDRAMLRLHENVQRWTDGVSDPFRRIERGILGYLGHFDANPWHVELLMLERAVFPDRRDPTYFRHQTEQVKPWRELLRGLVADGRVRDVPVERITDVVSHALYGTIFTNHVAGRRKTFEEQARDLVDVVMWGIRREAPRSAPKRGRA